MASIQSKISKSGKKIYYVVVSIRGKRKWIKAGTQKDAKFLKKQLESLAENERQERLGIAAKAKRVDKAFQEYLDNARLRTAPATVKRYRAALNTFLTFLGISNPRLKYLSQVTPEIIEAYQKTRLESIELKQASEANNPNSRKNKLLPKPQTVNYEVGVLRTVFIWANDRQWIASIPTLKVKPLRAVSKKQAKILSEEECKFLLETADELAESDPSMKVYALAFKFLLNTGLRSGELCNLTWGDLDIETGLIKIRAKEGWTPKSYAREFFLNKSALKALKKVGTKDGYIFISTSGKQLDSDQLRNALMKVANAAGLGGFTRVHDLRHTFNSLMQMNGVDPATMGKILGHRDIETTMIYTHQTQEHLKKSIEKIRI